MAKKTSKLHGCAVTLGKRGGKATAKATKKSSKKK